MFVISASLVNQFTQTQREASEALSWALPQFQPLSPLATTLPFVISSSFAHLFSWPTQSAAVDASRLSVPQQPLLLLAAPEAPATINLPVIISSVFAHLFTWPMLQAPPQALSWSRRLLPSPLNASSSILPLILSSSSAAVSSSAEPASAFSAASQSTAESATAFSSSAEPGFGV